MGGSSLDQGLETPAKIEAISLKRIDGEDRTFASSPVWFPLGNLVSAVEQVGIVSPLHLQRGEAGRLRIVMGFRRFRAAQVVGLTEVPGLLREGESQQLFREGILENVGSRCLHDLEKAWILLKLQSQFVLHESALIRDYLPLLGLRPDRFHLRRYQALARLPELIQRAVYEYLDGELAVKVARWQPDEQKLFLAISSGHRLGRNKQKLLFGLLDDLRIQQRLSAGGTAAINPLQVLWQEAGLEEIAKDEHKAPPERFERIVQRLREVRYPTLSQHEDRYRLLKKGLKLPPEIQLRLPPFFEGERVSVSFSCRTAEEFLSLADRLREVGKGEELREIFKLL